MKSRAGFIFFAITLQYFEKERYIVADFGLFVDIFYYLYA